MNIIDKNISVAQKWKFLRYGMSLAIFIFLVLIAAFQYIMTNEVMESKQYECESIPIDGVTYAMLSYPKRLLLSEAPYFAGTLTLWFEDVDGCKTPSRIIQSNSNSPLPTPLPIQNPGHNPPDQIFIHVMSGPNVYLEPLIGTPEGVEIILNGSDLGATLLRYDFRDFPSKSDDENQPIDIQFVITSTLAPVAALSLAPTQTEIVQQERYWWYVLLDGFNWIIPFVFGIVVLVSELSQWRQEKELEEWRTQFTEIKERLEDGIRLNMVPRLLELQRNWTGVSLLKSDLDQLNELIGSMMSPENGERILRELDQLVSYRGNSAPETIVSERLVSELSEFFIFDINSLGKNNLGNKLRRWVARIVPSSEKIGFKPADELMQITNTLQLFRMIFSSTSFSSPQDEIDKIAECWRQYKEKVRFLCIYGLSKILPDQETLEVQAVIEQANPIFRALLYDARANDVLPKWVLMRGGSPYYPPPPKPRELSKEHPDPHPAIRALGFRSDPFSEQLIEQELAYREHTPFFSQRKRMDRMEGSVIAYANSRNDCIAAALSLLSVDRYTEKSFRIWIGSNAVPLNQQIARSIAYTWLRYLAQESVMFYALSPQQRSSLLDLWYTVFGRSDRIASAFQVEYERQEESRAKPSGTAAEQVKQDNDSARKEVLRNIDEYMSEPDHSTRVGIDSLAMWCRLRPHGFDHTTLVIPLANHSLTSITETFGMLLDLESSPSDDAIRIWLFVASNGQIPFCPWPSIHVAWEEDVLSEYLSDRIKVNWNDPNSMPYFVDDIIEPDPELDPNRDFHNEIVHAANGSLNDLVRVGRKLFDQHIKDSSSQITEKIAAKTVEQILRPEVEKSGEIDS